MFDIGMQELIVIFIIILLVFGPKRAPELGRTVGKMLAELKKSLYDVKKQVETEFKESTSDIREAGKSLGEIKREVESGIKETMGIDALKQSVKEIREETDKAKEEWELEEKEEKGKEKEGEEEVEKEGEKKVEKEEGLDEKH
jgi:Tat protein translocase TatB subunit